MPEHLNPRCVKLILMYLDRAIMAAVEARFGIPLVAEARAEFAPRQFALLEYCARKDRAHDVTLFIRHPEDRELAAATRFAVIRKPSYPPGLFRPPSGGVEPGESFETGAAREGLEETGLTVELERYLLRVDSVFTCDGREAPWTTHVFLARALDAEIAPRDLKEIAEARWATVAEIDGKFRPRMLAMGSAGMRYRVDLQEAALQILGWRENTDETDSPGGAPRSTGSEVDGVLRLEHSRLLLFRGTGVPGTPGGSRPD